ncbi:MAG: hypothetical protein ACK5YO_29405, partial [Planctomyces sp.]
PFLNHIRPGSQHEVQVIRHDRLAQQINAKVPGLMNELFVDPNLTMVVVSAADRIMAQQKTPTHRAIHYVDNCNFICRKDFHASQSCHGRTSIYGKKAKGYPGTPVYRARHPGQQKIMYYQVLNH